MTGPRRASVCRGGGLRDPSRCRRGRGLPEAGAAAQDYSLRKSRGLLAAVSVSIACLSGCHERAAQRIPASTTTPAPVVSAPIGTPGTPGLAASREAQGLLSTLRARVGAAVDSGGEPILPAGLADTFHAVPGGLRPDFAAAAGRVSARVLLPQRSTAALHLEDAATGIGVDVSLVGARDVAAQAADGYVVYPQAHVSGATLLHRARPDGAEDFVSFDKRPSEAAIAYQVALGQGVSGLRLVAGTLEMLDAGGAPRLRVTPPYLVGADGDRRDAKLAVNGCSVDTNPAGPWGRRVTAPGAKTCTVSVSWDDQAVTWIRCGPRP